MAFSRDMTIVDELDGTTLSGATVMGKSGLIIGITDSSGKISDPGKLQFPLSIRNIGYDPLSVAYFSDTVRLVPAVYSLNEIVVKSGERPIKRILCYAREYATGATGKDTLKLYSEYILEAFLKDEGKKVKGYKDADSSPKIRNVKRYAFFSDSEGRDSITTPDDKDDLTILSWQRILAVPNISFRKRDMLTEGAVSDTIMGKHWPKNIVRNQNGIFSVKVDKLADNENHSWSPFFFKVIGMTMDVDNIQMSLAYQDNEAGEYSIDNYLYSTYSIHLQAKGKLFKWIFHTDESIEMDSYIELYPVSIEYMTLEEYKQARSSKEEIPFQFPINLQPLPEAIQKLIDKAAA